MNAQQLIARYRLQLEGLKSWPEGPEKQLMQKWCMRKIQELMRN